MKIALSYVFALYVFTHFVSFQSFIENSSKNKIQNNETIRKVTYSSLQKDYRTL